MATKVVTGENLAEFATKLNEKQKTIFAPMAAVGAPLTAETAAGMTDETKVYVYTGEEVGYTYGNWYYHDGTGWVSGGVYNATVYETDTTLTESGKPADAKAAGDGIAANVGRVIDGWVYRCYIVTSGAAGETVDIANPVTTTTDFRYAIVDCLPGDMFTVSGTGGLSGELFCFVDSENKIVMNCGTVVMADNHVIIAPSGSAKLIIQQASTDQRDCYRGFVPNAIEKRADSRTAVRTPSFAWSRGGIDSTGYITNTTNLRTSGIRINPGERLVVTNNNNSYSFAIYVCHGFSGRYNILTDGYMTGSGQVYYKYPNDTYYVRFKKKSLADISVSDGDKCTIEVKNDNYQVSSNAYNKTDLRVGFTRTYSFVNPFLNYERKDLQNDGTFTESTTRCIAKLPNVGAVEVKQIMYGRCFKVAKVDGSTVTYLVDEWSYYTYRYIGDGSSDYYVIVAASNSLSSECTPAAASRGIGVYTYVDEGVKIGDFWKLGGKHIAVIGDSITQGRLGKYGTTLNQTAVKPFGAIIAEQVGDFNYGNFGIGGAFVYNNDWKSLYANCTKVSGYDVVFVAGGTNDYGNNVPGDDFEAAYTYVIDTLMTNNTEVVVCTPIYRTSKTGSNTQGLSLYSYVTKELTIAETKGIKGIDLYTLTNVPGFTKYLSDGLHPNEIGQEIIARLILEEYNRLS